MSGQTAAWRSRYSASRSGRTCSWKQTRSIGCLRSRAWRGRGRRVLPVRGEGARAGRTTGPRCSVGRGRRSCGLEVELGDVVLVELERVAQQDGAVGADLE